jgi:ATP-dependent Lon protease
MGAPDDDHGLEDEVEILLPRVDSGEDGEEEVLSLPALKDDDLPKLLVVFPLRRSVPFPGLIMPVHAEQGYETGIMEKALADGQRVGLLLAPGMDESGVIKRSSEMARIGVVAEIHKRIRLPDGNTNYLCRGLRRFSVERFARLRSIPVARVSYPEDIYPAGDETEALARNVLSLAQKVAAHNPSLGDGFNLAALNIDPSGNLADFAAAYLLKDTAGKQAILEELDVRERLRMVDEGLTRELVTLELGDRIQEEIRERIEAQQKEYFLREQIRIIRRELGEEREPQEQDRELFLGRLQERNFPPEVEAKVRDEVERLGTIPQASPEYSVVRNYLEWLTELPWGVSSEDRIDLDAASRLLERDHFGLKEAKERILEYLGVRKMRPDHRGAILCFVGPPGVGKTSLAMAIAKSMGRELERMSLGGMRDEAEIKGHRRTYIGALPGRVMQMIRRAGTDNPVIVLDELDKLGKDFRGDPSSALLEVLDPAQNHAFLDLFLDVPFDLSKVMFVATANSLYDIPGPLRDRMEVIELAGYLRNEKVKIAQRHLLPRQLAEHGLEPKRLKVSVATMRALIDRYTREAGVRGLEKQLASLCRKRTLEIARRKRPRPVVEPEQLVDYLGPARFTDDPIRLHPGVGVALGVAYTSYGGDVLEIECAAYPGNGRIQATGRLGDVMMESCRIAHSFLRDHGDRWGLDPKQLAKHDLHLHFPAGAVPKDGPSAGTTIASAILSRLTGRHLRVRTAMTGEITLTGEVMPVGGIREKVLSAKRLGVKRVLLPAENERDVQQLEEEWTRGLDIIHVEHFDGVVREAFGR